MQVLQQHQYVQVVPTQQLDHLVTVQFNGLPQELGLLQQELQTQRYIHRVQLILLREVSR